MKRTTLCLKNHGIIFEGGKKKTTTTRSLRFCQNNKIKYQKHKKNKTHVFYFLKLNTKK